MNKSSILAATCLALAGVLASCGPEQPKPVKPMVASAPAGPTSRMAPCADQLHDICGQLLLYYYARKDLPESLDKMGKGAANLLNCPSSNKPYVYNPAGLAVPGWTGRLIVYDAKPYHYGMQWGILAEPPRPGKPLVLRVVQFSIWQGQPAIRSEKKFQGQPGRGPAADLGEP